MPKKTLKSFIQIILFIPFLISCSHNLNVKDDISIKAVSEKVASVTLSAEGLRELPLFPVDNVIFYIDSRALRETDGTLLFDLKDPPSRYTLTMRENVKKIKIDAEKHYWIFAKLTYYKTSGYVSCKLNGDFFAQNLQTYEIKLTIAKQCSLRVLQ